MLTELKLSYKNNVILHLRFLEWETELFGCKFDLFLPISRKVDFPAFSFYVNSTFMYFLFIFL